MTVIIVIRAGSFEIFVGIISLVAEPQIALRELIGRRMPDLDLVTSRGPLRVYTLLHDARPVLLNFGEPGGVAIGRWADRVQSLDANTMARGSFRQSGRSLLPPPC